MAGGLLQDVLPVIVYALEFITRHTLNLPTSHEIAILVV